MAAGPGPRSRRRPPLPGPVERLLLARAVRRRSTSATCGSRRYEHLIAAEDLADRAAGALDAAETLDLDLDGADEVRLATAGQVVTVDLDEGAGIGDWDVRAARHAVTAVLRRRPEAYHAKIAHDERDGRPRSGEGAAAASIHDGVRAKEAHLADHLVYDTHERRSGLVRLLPADATADDWANARTEDLGDTVDGAFEVVGAGARTARRRAARPRSRATARVRVTKSIVLGGGRLDPSLTVEVEVENVGDDADRRAARPRMDDRRCSVAAATRRPGGRSPASAARTTARARPTRSPTLAQGNDVHRDLDRDDGVRARRRPGGRRSRRSRTRRAASSAPTRAAACCSRGRWPSGRASAGRRRSRTP